MTRRSQRSARAPRPRRREDCHLPEHGWGTLDAGVPVAEVARRAGNSPEVIHRRYEGCIEGHEELNNKKIERAMGWSS